MNNISAFLKIPQDFKGKFLIYPPKINDIVGNNFFPQYRKLLLSSQEEIEDDYVEYSKKTGKKNDYIPTPYEFLLGNSYNNKQIEQLAKDAFFFFTKQEVSFLYEKKLIVIGNLEKELKRIKKVEDLVFLKEDEFFEFQNELRISLGEKPIEPPNPKEHPRIREMKAKARYRDKIKAKKKMGLDLLSSLASICCMGIGITPLNIGEMSYASIDLLIRTYQEKEKYDIDIRSLQAGASSKKVKPKYWIRNLDQ